MKIVLGIILVTNIFTLKWVINKLIIYVLKLKKELRPS